MRIIIVIAVVIATFITGLSLYLAPDDLAGCEPRPTAGKCQAADAIVAISGGDTAARTHEAIRLFQAGWGDTLIFSGAALDKTGPSNAKAMRQIAIDAGVPVEQIVVEENAATTRQNAENTQDIIHTNGIDSIILVTSGYHQRRSELEFNKLANGELEIINHPVPSDRQWSSTWWLTPHGWYLAGSEVVKIIAFYLGGTR